MRPRPELAGAHLHLRKVRFLTYRAGDVIDRRLVVDLLREAIEIGSMSSGERDALAAHIAEGAETRALAPANNGADALRARRGRRGDMRSGGSTGARILG